jgi:hypothetical protein
MNKITVNSAIYEALSEAFSKPANAASQGALSAYSLHIRYPADQPKVNSIAMLPRVAFEYGHT